jgi:hypothetical protein
MADESIGGASVPAPVAATAAPPCCEKQDAATAGACVLCRKPVCKNCRRYVNGKLTCVDCLRKILAEIDAETATGAQLLPAVLGGLVAAILCGAAWMAMVVALQMEIGYAAIGVGYATGWGVRLGARKKKGAKLQLIAVVCSIFGLLLGKYFTVTWYVVTKVPAAHGMSWVDPRLFKIFVQILPKVLSPWDLLWAFIALRAAFRIPRPTSVRVVKSKLAV